MLIDLSHKRLARDGIKRYGHKTSYRRARAIYLGEEFIIPNKSIVSKKIAFQNCVRDRGKYKKLKRDNPPACPPELYGGALMNHDLARKRWEAIAEMYLDDWTAEAIAECFGMKIMGVRQALKRAWGIEPIKIRKMKTLADIPNEYKGHRLLNDKMVDDRRRIVKKFSALHSVKELSDILECSEGMVTLIQEDYE